MSGIILLSVDQFVCFVLNPSASWFRVYLFPLQGLWLSVRWIVVLRCFYASSYFLLSVLLSLILSISFLFLLFFFLYIWFFIGWSINIFIYYSILVVCAVRRVFFRFFPMLFVSFVFLQMCSSLKCGQNFSPQYQRIFSPRLFWWKALFFLPKRMALFVPTLEVLRDRNVGLPPITSTVFHLIRSRSQSSCSVCLVKRILLLRFLTRSTALTGRYSWLAYQNSPVIPWLLHRSAPLKGFWAGLRSKKTL